MSLPTPYSAISDPNLGALLKFLKSDIFFSFNCVQVGEIVKFNPDGPTVSVQLKIQRLIPDRTSNPLVYVPKTLPLIIDCPVFIPAGGTGRLTFPVIPGDSCVVLFNDRDLDNWWTTGGTLPPNSSRAHDLSDGIALVGIRNQANKITDYNTTDAELRFAGGRLKINDKIALDGAAATLKTVIQKLIDMGTALNAKTGPSAAAQITAAQTEADNLLQ